MSENVPVKIVTLPWRQLNRDHAEFKTPDVCLYGDTREEDG